MFVWKTDGNTERDVNAPWVQVLALPAAGGATLTLDGSGVTLAALCTIVSPRHGNFKKLGGTAGCLLLVAERDDDRLPPSNPFGIFDGAGARLIQPVTLPTLTKGVQGATGASTQDLKDAGRVWKSWAQVGTPTTTDTILTMTPTSDGVVGSNGTSFAVTAGKRLRIQCFTAATINAGAAGQGAIVNLRASSSGAVTVASPLVAVLGIGTPLAVANIADGDSVPFPDGFELSGTMQFGITLFGTATAGLRVTVVGYEY